MRAVPLVVFVIAVVLSVAAQESQRLEDKSDWWSLLKDDTLGQGVSPQKRQPAENNFRISGLTLGDGPEQISKKLGQAVQVDRGDAATGRHQLCYVSASGNIHLIFEWGEVESVVYLFEDGEDWAGREFCAASPHISAKTSTLNGLKLGLTPNQLTAILGKPNVAERDKLLYLLEYRTRYSPQVLKTLRSEYPQMSDAEFQKNLSHFDVTVFFDARFKNGKLHYLAISRSETD